LEKILSRKASSAPWLWDGAITHSREPDCTAGLPSGRIRSPSGGQYGSSAQPEEEMRHSGTCDTEIFGDKEILQISPLARGWNG
jgi:hypothetical protein